MKKIAIFGSTGSIGVQTLQVVKQLEDVEVVALSTHKNIDRLKDQIAAFHPRLVVVKDKQKAKVLAQELAGQPVEVLSGMKGLKAMAEMEEVDTVVMSLVGNVGILPTYQAIAAGKNIALATKEVLVSGGSLIMQAVKENGVQLTPIDSEHSAIFQCLQGAGPNRIQKILLTASGGPVRGKDRAFLQQVTPEMALHHPNWSMGPKITIDSSTLMNKGLEVMEARWLFDVPVEKIEVLVHPQSIVHSAVEYTDGAVIAQMGVADMRLPIAYALTYPKRFFSPFPKLDLTKVGPLTFEKPDKKAFPCLQLAYDAMREGGLLPTVLNGANEVAVARFLRKEIDYLSIPRIIACVMDTYTNHAPSSIEELMEADRWSREKAAQIS